MAVVAQGQLYGFRPYGAASATLAPMRAPRPAYPPVQLWAFMPYGKNTATIVPMRVATEAAASTGTGQLSSFMPYSLPSMQLAPMRTPVATLGWAARYAPSRLGAGGTQVLSGHTYLEGVPVSRRVTILTQPPAAKIVYEATTSRGTGAFSFPRLPPGKYMVIDSTFEGSPQALVYDWIVV